MKDRHYLYCLSALIIAYLLYLNQAIINYYFNLFLMFIAVGFGLVGLYGVTVGLFFLTMKWLEIQEKQAEVLGKRRLVQVLNAGQSLAVLDGDNQVLVTAPNSKALPAPPSIEPVAKQIETPIFEPEILRGEWWHNTIEVLKADVEKYNSAIKIRIVGPDGSGKSVFTNTIINALIEPFPNAKTLIVDCEAQGDNDKWGIPVLCNKVEGYEASLNHITNDMNEAEISIDKPNILVVDEIDQFNALVGKEGVTNTLGVLLKRGRKRGYWPVVIGQSEQVQNSGINTDINKLFNVTIYLGFSAISGFFKSRPSRDFKHKNIWLDALEKLAERNENNDKNFIGLATFPNDPTINNAFLFVLPELKATPIKPTTAEINSIKEAIKISNWPTKKSDITAKKKGLSAEKILSEIQKNPDLFRDGNRKITQASIAKFYKTYNGGSNHPVLSKIAAKVHQLGL